LADAAAGIPPSVWELVRSAPSTAPVIDDLPPAEALRLAAERQSARERKDWAAADEYRRQIAVLGWTLQDTPDGPKLIKT
jgi:cysteinyl-tRNA synthetase